MNILDIVFPRICVGCGHEGGYICEICQSKMVIPEQICPMCCKSSLDGWTHPRCRSIYGIDRLVIGLPYRGVVQQCLKKVKYKSAWEILSFLYQIWNPDLGFSNVIITSVSMWKHKEQVRGFNQAEILAQLIAKDCKVANLPAQAGIAILERVRETKPMFGLKKKERRENIEGAFRIINSQIPNIKQRQIILVDDVWTTGATMRECARVLKQAGAGEVWGLAIAR